MDRLVHMENIPERCAKYKEKLLNCNTKIYVVRSQIQSYSLNCISCATSPKKKKISTDNK